jgi:hypothetical protein
LCLIQEFLCAFWLCCLAAQPETENTRNVLMNLLISEFTNLPKRVDE